MNYNKTRKILFVISGLGLGGEEKQLIDLITKEKNLSKYLENKEIKKKIFIQNKLINIIV